MKLHPQNQTFQGEPQLLTIVQACQRLSVGRSTLYNLISAGKLPLRKIGGASRVRSDELDAFIQELPKVAEGSATAGKLGGDA